MGELRTLFDELREINGHGELLRDRPGAMWCRHYEESLDQWTEMGGVPADLSTVECLVPIALTLWRQYKALAAVMEQLIAAEAAG